MKKKYTTPSVTVLNTDFSSIIAYSDTSKTLSISHEVHDNIEADANENVIDVWDDSDY